MSLFYYCNRIEKDTAIFDFHETGHLKVMKQKEGETITFTDGQGNIYKGVISTLQKNEAIIKISTKEKDLSHESKKHIEITAGLSRWNRFSLLIEKAVELGVKTINIAICKRSNYQRINLEKVERTARKALKQCGGTIMPEIRTMNSLLDACNEEVIPVILNPRSNRLINKVYFPPKTNIFIGPEGGFTERELDEIRSISTESLEISLGHRMLRLETAAIIAIGYISLIN